MGIDMKTITVKKIGNMLMINNEFYQPIWASADKSGEVIKFKKIDKEKFKKLSERISEKLKSKLKSKDIIENALADLTLKQLERINVELEKKKPVIRKKQGCYEMVVGKTTIPIR